MRWDFWRRKRRETDLDDEIAYDLALEAEERIRSGATPQEAQHASRRDFGNVGLLKEGIRETWGWTSIERLGRDIRYSWRTLRNSPLFATMAVLSLALGIGANASIFSVINAILLRPLPGVERASEVFSLNNKVSSSIPLPLVSYPDYRDFRDRNSVLTGLAAIGFVPASVGLKGNCQRLFGYTVSGNYFEVLGIKPLAGRLIQPEDDKVRGGHPVIVLSYAGWQKRFGGDLNIVGTKMQVNGREFTVLGITPQGFFGTELFFAPDVFFSISMQKALEGEGGNDLDRRSARGFFSVGRLKPGVSMARAESALDAIGRQMAQEYPQEDGGMQVKLAPPGLAGAFLRKPIIQFAGALFGVSCLVLLVACVNLASMLLARAGDKRKETAIRLALGAGRGVLIRQLLTENLMVALAGGAGGALLALWITSGLAAWHPPVDIPMVVNVPVDFRVFLFALLVSTFTALLFGLLPAFQATKTDLVPALKNEAVAARFRHWHLRDYMVAAQVSMSVLLLFCSVLVVKSLQRSLDAPIGFEMQGLATVSFDLNMQGYDEPRGRDFQKRILEKVRQLPGVESAALADNFPLTLTVPWSGVYVEGKPVPKRADLPNAYFFAVSPDYFKTMRTHLISGREFEDRDQQGGQRVAIVSSSFASELLDGGNPLGRRFSTGPTEKPIEIVGVVETGSYYKLNEPGRAFWTPLAADYKSKASLVVRTRTVPPQSVLPAIRAMVNEIDPAMALFSTGSMEDQLAWTFFPPRIAAIALSAFGVLALVLATTGIYGVMAYAVSRRTREIGIRMAIGATQARVLASVARSAGILIGTGLVLGLGMALLAGGFLEHILYGVKPSDPVTFAIVFALMLGIGGAATFIPARRATRIDPTQALRQE
jgi:macrolide transport system ATP-binding/permease protein